MSRTKTSGDQGEALAWFAGELSRELDVTVYGPEGAARLLFPEYTELYEENCPAHHFDYFISGAGYPYHHCFRQKRLSLKEYDALWRDFLGMEHDEAAALRLAWRRLRWPADLGETAAADTVEKRQGKEFISIEEFSLCCNKLSKTHIDQLKALGAFAGMADTSQITLF